VLGLPAALCAAWTVFAGKDLSWDLLNYHYYAPFQLLEGRLQQDFFAASAQSYLNPLGYLPFYLLVAAGVHSVAVSVALAAAHSLGIALLYLIAWRVFGHLPPRERLGLACLATALGAASAVYWATVGTSFLDPLLVVPMLAGLLLVLERRHFAAAGFLFGAAAALKYSNAIFALAALAFVLTSRRAFLAYAAGGAAAVALLAGPWLVLMGREFGNPLFPLANAWFQSPHAPVIGPGERFAPQDLLAALAFPFRMALLDRSLYAETFAPDLRPAALVLAALVLPFFPRKGSFGDFERRLLVFFAIAALAWLVTSANARYGMLVLLLAGVVLARLVERLLPLGVARATLGVLLLVQLAMIVIAAPPRWFVAEPWTRHWLPYEAPARARSEPALYLSLETLPMAVLAPFVHPASSFVNLRGQHSLAPDAPRLAALLERHRGRVRALGRGLELVGGAPQPLQVRSYDATLARLGLRIDAADCSTIEWRRDGGDALSVAANWVSRTPPSSEPLSAVSCGLVPAPRDPGLAEKERRVSAVFDRVEKACARLFRGHTALSEPFGSGWMRNYAGLDARLEAIGESLVLNRYRAGQLVELGRLADWARDGAPLPAPCR
jgi:hypothetical protein